ncbi:hypothetical protein H7F51_16420 [Novosphingobium flavum]|uniref:Uncharacterized protein n=1 Tax=Novosphingobium flavum TaxID=1778672 RepID=A0A7X1FU90_9SPHN|nr:hypothetical protein [Novosphingobium flavum]MBC2667105.1 hypothetical protein [Novosphingobium flavum]
MERHGEEVHLDTTEARGGDTPHVVRYMLIFGLVLAILALSAIWITGAATSPQGERTGHVTNQATPES